MTKQLVISNLKSCCSSFQSLKLSFKRFSEHGTFHTDFPTQALNTTTLLYGNVAFENNFLSSLTHMLLSATQNATMATTYYILPKNLQEAAGPNLDTRKLLMGKVFLVVNSTVYSVHFDSPYS